MKKSLLYIFIISNLIFEYSFIKAQESNGLLKNEEIITYWNKEKKQSKENITAGEAVAKTVLGEIFSNIEAYKYVVNKFNKEYAHSNEKPKFIAELRRKDDSRKWGLLFKPLPQLALLEAILFLKSSDGGDLDKKQIYNAINEIDWSYDKGSQFENMVITPESNILSGSKILERLMTFLALEL